MKDLSTEEESNASSPAAADGKKPVRFRLSESIEFLDATEREHRTKVQDHLRTSLQMQHLTILCGSGTSIEAGGPSMTDLWEAAQSLTGFSDACSAVSYTEGNNIEEFLSRCDAFTELTPNHPKVPVSRKATIELILTKCRIPALSTEHLVPHQELLKKVARRRVRDSRVKLFTTNYDLCFERAAADLGVVPIDGFSFSYPRRFDPQFFDFDIVKRTSATEIAAFIPGVFQYFKLHGSVDWSNRNGRIEIDDAVSPDEACLIYPAQAKFQRSYQQPHLELMARYLAALREHNTCLVVIGFGFNDAHLSGPILAALKANPHFRLIVVSRGIEQKIATASPGSPHFELAELMRRADISLVASSFADFVDLIPDLAALSPAHELESAVLRVTGKRP